MNFAVLFVPGTVVDPPPPSAKYPAPSDTFPTEPSTDASVTEEIVPETCSDPDIIFEGSNTAITFQNLTNINSTLIFCRATADEFNYSSNPTYVNSSNRIVVIEPGQESNQKAFSYITTVGLYDKNDNLIAIAKTSRPLEKNDEKDMTIRVRLDF